MEARASNFLPNIKGIFFDRTKKEIYLQRNRYLGVLCVFVCEADIKGGLRDLSGMASSSFFLFTGLRLEGGHQKGPFSLPNKASNYALHK